MGVVEGVAMIAVGAMATTITDVSVSSVSCPMCDFNCPTRNLWISHLRSVHSKDDNFSVTCDINDCGLTYNKCSSLVSHMYRQHRESLIATAVMQSSSVTFQSEGNVDEIGSSVLFDGDEQDTIVVSDIQHAVNSLLKIDEDEQTKRVALFILHLKEGRNLSQIAVNDIVKEVNSLFKHIMGRTKAVVQDCLNGSNPEDCIENLFSSVTSPFEAFHSSYLQEAYFRSHLGCMDPVEVKMGSPYYTTKFSGNKRRRALVSDTFQYIPVEETLKCLLHLPEVRKEIEICHASSDSNYRDICDGSVFKCHPLFMTECKAIQIIAYFDEVEVCNPLGSSSKKHKLGCMFFTIGNFRPHFRSRLKNIFLISVIRSVLIRKHGINSFLQPFVQSMLSLCQNGVTVKVKGLECQYKAALLAVLADNLGAHAIGGFKESMSFARRICRSCMATPDQIQHDFCESNFELRTPQKHARQVSSLSGASSAQNSIDFGINRKSILDDIPNFSVVKNLPHDIMHDLLEGVIPYEMKFLLEYLVEKKYILPKTLNQRLKSFNFGYSELSDKPSDLDERIYKRNDQKIRQSASKMWLLAIYLPLLIGDLVPQDCEQWELFCLLLKITSIAASWVIDRDTVAYFSVLVEEHHFKFKKLYPNFSLIPKMHYMLHYSKQIQAFGPMTGTWTMRHESKLNIIKRAASHGNHVNVCFSVTKRYLQSLCYSINCDQSLLNDTLESSGDNSELSVLYLPKELQDVVNDTTENTTIFQLKWIKIRHFNLKKNAFVYLEKEEYYPKFGKIINLYLLRSVNKSSHIMYLQIYETKYFDSHFNGYVIAPLSSTYLALNTNNLKLYPILHGHKAFHDSMNTYIVVK